MPDTKGTITQRLESTFDSLQSEFKSIYSREDFYAKLNAVKNAGNKSDRPTLLSELYNMYRLSGIEFEEGRNVTYYRKLIESSNIPEIRETEDRLMYALYNKFEEFPSPTEYMTRLVDRLSTSEDYADGDTLRVKILKRFIKYGNYLKDAGFGGNRAINDYVKTKSVKNPTPEEILQNVDDNIFNCLLNANVDQKKPKGKYGLLKTCDDLAAGKFRTGGSTQKNLYLFAMAFGMTYHSGNKKNGEIIDYKTDIEINLFRDYYATSLVSFMMASDSEQVCEFELDPSGIGINYKNFAEMIYIYFIAQNCSPQEKIRLSTEMIKRVKDSDSHAEKQNVTVGNTEHYRAVWGKADSALPDIDVLSMPADEFESFICREYNCKTVIEYKDEKGNVVKKQIGALQVEDGQNTAIKEYTSILNEIIKRHVPIEDCNYGLFITDVSAYKKEGYKTICDQNKAVDKEKFDKFMQLLTGINYFMGVNVEEKVSCQNEEQEHTERSRQKAKAMWISTANQMTRTAMIVAYYYYFNAVHEDDGVDKWKNFGELFASFKAGVDEKLAKAHYQPLSGRNIFDVLVVFSSYAYINI